MKKMLLYYITVKRNDITKKAISKYCKNFFELDFKSQYIIVQVSLRTNKGTYYDIGKLCTIDVTNDINKQSFKNKVTDDYLTLFELLQKNKKNDEKINRFIFEYKPTTIFEIMEKNTK